MFIPGFDPKSMSDDELATRSSDLLRKLGWAERFASMGQGGEQLTAMLGLIEAERNERLFMEQWRLVAPQAADPIESDPGLRDAARAAKDSAQAPQHARTRPRIAVRRPFPTPTPHPVEPGAAPDATDKEPNDD